MKKKDTGFTLIEILVAIAIVAILSSVVLVSLSSFRSKGRSTKALASLSSAIPSMIQCWGNGGTVSSPSSGADICNLAASYGKWPATSEDLNSYSYDGTTASSTSWFITLSSQSEDKKRVCCNSAMNSCKIQAYASGAWDESCSESAPAE